MPVPLKVVVVGDPVQVATLDLLLDCVSLLHSAEVGGDLPPPTRVRGGLVNDRSQAVSPSPSPHCTCPSTSGARSTRGSPRRSRS